MTTYSTALVTGGCGFVGRHFVKWLLEHDYYVTVVDDLSTGLHPDRWPVHLRVPAHRQNRFRFYQTDFRSYASNASPDFDQVLHLAAVVGGRLTIEGDPLAVATDLAIDATLFHWIAKHPVKPRKVFYFSSSAAYPIELQTAGYNRPLVEEDIGFAARMGMPDMTYGWSKLTGEYLARHAVERYDIDVVIYRPFSGYGEDQDLSYPFPSILRRVARCESPIVVWGSGRQLRDFIYIGDVVEAVFASAYRMDPGEALNLGSGQGTSFQELAERASEVTGHSAEVVNDPTKPEGVFARVADCARMRRYFKPKTTLRQGIEIVYEYQAAAGPAHAAVNR